MSSQSSSAISWADPEGRTGGPDPPPEKSQNIGFLSNTGPDPLKNHKATKPAFNVGPPSARQRNAILMMMARFWWYLDPLAPHQLKKMSESDPLWQNFLDPRMNFIIKTGFIMWVLVSLFHQKPADLDLHFFQRRF